MTSSTLSKTIPMPMAPAAQAATNPYRAFFRFQPLTAVGDEPRAGGAKGVAHRQRTSPGVEAIAIDRADRPRPGPVARDRTPRRRGPSSTASTWAANASCSSTTSTSSSSRPAASRALGIVSAGPSRSSSRGSRAATADPLRTAIGFEPELLRRLFGGQQHRRAAIGEIGGVAGGDGAELAIEDRSQLGQLLHGRVAANPVVGAHALKRGGGKAGTICRLKRPSVGGRSRAVMRRHRVLVLRLAGDPEALGQPFAVLTHDLAGGELGQGHRFGQQIGRARGP